MEIENLRSQICGLMIASSNDITVNDVIGADTVSITGNGFINYPFQKIEFSETKSKSGDYVVQELKATLTDNSINANAYYDEMLCTNRIIVLKYSDGNSKVIGNNESPISFVIEKSGVPAVATLSFKRYSAEFAKFLESL